MGFFFGFLDDGKAIDCEVDFVLTAYFFGTTTHVGDLVLEPLEGIAVHEVVVGDIGTVVAGVFGIAALEDQRMGSVGEIQWFRREGIVVELVEIALECELLVGPDAFDAFNEFSASSVKNALVRLRRISGDVLPISLGMFQPPLPNAGELCFEPSRYYIYRNSAFRVVINTRNLFRSNSWVPWSWKKSSNDVQFCGCMK